MFLLVFNLFSFSTFCFWIHVFKHVSTKYMVETINVYKWKHNILIELLRLLLFKVQINEKYTSNMMELFNTFNIQVEIVSRYFNLF